MLELMLIDHECLAKKESDFYIAYQPRNARLYVYTFIHLVT